MYTHSRPTTKDISYLLFETDSFFIGILLRILKFYPFSQLLITSIKYHLYSDPQI